MARIVLTPTALEHLRDIQAYIRRDSPSTAKAVVRRIRTAIVRLGAHPTMGRVVPEYDEPRVRELIVTPFRVIYLTDSGAGTVRVLAVIHGSRTLPPLRAVL